MSRPEDIPQDVWAVAEGLYARSEKFWHDVYWHAYSDVNLTGEVARAILAERERCTKVAKFIRENAAKMSMSERDDVWLNLMDRVAEGIELGVQF